jgi:ATP-dependent helicase/nuclease subunit A
MTIHQAKGLGFDMVILPELDRNTMVRSRDLSFLLSRDTKTQRPRWALQLPRRVVAVCDDTLREEIEGCDADAAFESLCLLYVAMTRAKRALYVVTSHPGRSSQVYNQPALVKERLVGNSRATEADGEAVTLAGQTFTMLYRHGSTEWYRTIPLSQTAAQREMAAPDIAGILTIPCRRSQLTAVRPSETDNLDPSAGDLFDPARRQRLDAGIAVHSLLQGIDWSDSDPEPVIAKWSAGSTLSQQVRERAIAHVRQALAGASIRRHLDRPQGRIVLWRERHFDVVARGRWITGSFDRVVLEQNADGTAIAATLYDFKTDDVPVDAVSTRATQYEPQMILYRDALSHILRLPPSRIRMVLLFTGAGVAHELPSG